MLTKTCTWRWPQQTQDLNIKPPPRKQKLKNVRPVGRNGLKKQRVEKSWTSFDEKGYMGGFFLCFYY